MLNTDTIFHGLPSLIISSYKNYHRRQIVFLFVHGTLKSGLRKKNHWHGIHRIRMQYRKHTNKNITSAHYPFISFCKTPWAAKPLPHYQNGQPQKTPQHLFRAFSSVFHLESNLTTALKPFAVSSMIIFSPLVQAIPSAPILVLTIALPYDIPSMILIRRPLPDHNGNDHFTWFCLKTICRFHIFNNKNIRGG